MKTKPVHCVDYAISINFNIFGIIHVKWVSVRYIEERASPSIYGYNYNDLKVLFQAFILCFKVANYKRSLNNSSKIAARKSRLT